MLGAPAKDKDKDAKTKRKDDQKGDKDEEKDDQKDKDKDGSLAFLSAALRLRYGVPTPRARREARWVAEVEGKLSWLLGQMHRSMVKEKHRIPDNFLELMKQAPAIPPGSPKSSGGGGRSPKGSPKASRGSGGAAKEGPAEQWTSIVLPTETIGWGVVVPDAAGVAYLSSTPRLTC